MLAALGAAGIIYYIFASHGHSLPCVFYEITGLYCPGCGATRMCRHFAKLELAQGFRSNQGTTIILPFLIAVALRSLYCYIRYGKKAHDKWINIGAIICVAVMCIFGVMRNIPFFDFLRPI